MKKITTCFLLIITFCSFLSAQKDTVVFNRHKSEIGIDFQNLFKASLLGGTLVYKKRIGLKDFSTYDKTKTWRLRFGGSFNSEISSKENLETLNENITEGNSIIEAENNTPPEHQYSFYALSGVEWQTQKKRVQYYTGFELGYSFARNSEVKNLNYSANELVSKRNIKSYSQSGLLHGFVGCKFFLSPNFSIGLESNINSSISMTRTTDIAEDRIIESTRINTLKSNSFRLGFDYLSALYFSYYY